MKKNDGEKYIGLVKWFHDNVKKANYGFIQHAKLGDLFFHEASIDQGQAIDAFHENSIVVFNTQESQKHKGKLEAVAVRSLENETDIDFLFAQFLSILNEKSNYSDYNLVQKGVHTKIISLIEKTTDKEIVSGLFIRFCNYVKDHLLDKSLLVEEYLKVLFKVCKSFFPDSYSEISTIIESKISFELAHKLWMDNFIQNCQINYISSVIFSIKPETRKEIIIKCNEKERLNIFFKVVNDFGRIDSEQKLILVKTFLQFVKELTPEQYEKIIIATLNVCPDYFKINMWLDGYHEQLEFDNYKNYSISLSTLDQKKFVKKVLKYIHEGKSTISVEDLTSLNLIDYETSKRIEQFDNSRLDYSTSIILNVISELKKQTKFETKKDSKLAQNRIYELILKQIKEPKDILQVTGYFDECTGRCSVSVHENKNDNGDVIGREITYKRNEYQKPKNHPICDGRKAIDRATKVPLLSDEELEYWWCANQKCFKPSRNYHNASDWENYSLLDFLKILKIEYTEADFEIYLNIINKANRFLKHLKCRECNHILYPKGKTQYAFYGVNDFICRTEGCTENGKDIYLSHCSNGYCEMEIDSRDCVKCKPPVINTESCGWYICNFCHSCCNGEQLQRRKWVYDNILHSEYKCHLIGHRDLGLICCNKCGDPMESIQMDILEYDKILNWFIKNRESSNRIRKSGKNKFDKWWFLFLRGDDTFEGFKERLKRYHNLGFQIPDIAKDKDSQLISEPIDFKKHNGDVLNCKNCGNSLDLSIDLERARAIKKYHKIRFANESI